ncbi:MAG: hypothetical protein ACTS5I_05695, partial [Rhodanobacter sp.]
MLAFGPAAVQAQQRLPESGQLLQQLSPVPAPPLSTTTGLDVQHPAVAARADSVPFHVNRIEVTGASLLPTAKLHALVA